MAYPLHTLALGFKNLAHWHKHHNREVQLPSDPASSVKPQLLFVGWDAADWNYIDPLVAKGLLPAIQGLVINGARGPLNSLRPMLSPMLWTTIATGLRPFDHGIHGFVTLDENNNTVPISSEFRSAATFWEIAHHQNLESHIIGWWPSYPPENIKGIIVSDAFTQLKEPPSDAVYPQNKQTIFEQLRIQEHWIEEDLLSPLFENCPPNPPIELVAAVRRALARSLSVQMYSSYLLHTGSANIHAVYLNPLDHFHHLGLREYPEYFEIVNNAYRLYDAMLEGLLECIDHSTNIVLVSDHGFKLKKDLLPTLPDDPIAAEKDHHQQGVVLLNGPAINPRTQLSGCTILDVAPNILHLLNIPADLRMEGRIWNEAYKNPEQPRIKTWASAIVSKNNKIGRIENHEHVQHLIELGYLDKRTNATPQNILAENQFLLARSYSEAGRNQEAIRILIPLLNTPTPPIRYIISALDLMITEGEIKDFESWFGKLQHLLPKHILSLFRIRYFLLINDFSSAIEELKTIPKPPHINTAWLLQVGRLWLNCSEYSQAENQIQQALEIEPDNPEALMIAGLVHFQNQQWEQALNFFLESIENRFFAPRIHALIGHSLVYLNQPLEAEKAFKIAALQEPRNQTNTSENKSSTVIVSGLPRSGTSLMMRILETLNYPIFSDQARAGDQHNPHGYFEHSDVIKLAFTPEIAQKFSGHAVKILSPSLPALPPYQPVTVIMMERQLSSVVSSQLKMRNVEVLPLNLEAKMADIQQRALDFCQHNKHWIKIIHISYDELIAQPKVVLKSLTQSLNQAFNPKLLELIDPKLKHY